MGVWNTLRTWVLGVDVEQVQADADAADAGNAALNRDAFEDGRWTPEQWDEAQQRMEDGRIDGEAQVGAEFWAGWDEAADKWTGGIRRVTAAPVEFILRALPWWVWVAAGLWALWYLGLWRRLRNAAA